MKFLNCALIKAVSKEELAVQYIYVCHHKMLGFKGRILFQNDDSYNGIESQLCNVKFLHAEFQMQILVTNKHR